MNDIVLHSKSDESMLRDKEYKAFENNILVRQCNALLRCDMKIINYNNIIVHVELVSSVNLSPINY